MCFVSDDDGDHRHSRAGSDGGSAGESVGHTKSKGKFHSLGKIFKPWKWRKKKSSEKFKETSEGTDLMTYKTINTNKVYKDIFFEADLFYFINVNVIGLFFFLLCYLSLSA